MSDYISRQAAIEAMIEDKIQTKIYITLTAERDFEVFNGACDRHAKMLKELPSAQPERKKGKWIEVDDYYNRISGRCSVCGWESHLYEDDVVGMNFCPNCGADMRGEQDE